MLIVTIGTVVGEGGTLHAMLFEALLAGIAVLAGVDHAGNADCVADLEPGKPLPTWVTLPITSWPGTTG